MIGDVTVDDLLEAIRALVRVLTRPGLPAGRAAEHSRQLAVMFTELDERMSSGEPVPTSWVLSTAGPGDYPPCPLPRCGGLVPATLPMCFAHWWKAPPGLRHAYNLAIRENCALDRDRIGRELVAAVAGRPASDSR